MRLRLAQIVVLGGLCQGMTCLGSLPAGERRHRGPESVWNSYDCGKKLLPFVVVERNVVRPTNIAPGGELRHVLIYSMCPESAGLAVRGRLIRRVLLAGQVIHDDAAEGFELKPGRWILTAFIKVPPAAPAGGYELVVEFEGAKVRFKEKTSFRVRD